MSSRTFSKYPAREEKATATTNVYVIVCGASFTVATRMVMC